MRQVWIEFETTANAKFIVRPEYIDSVVDNDNYTSLRYSSGDSEVISHIKEPYEQVKQKIMDAERTYYTAIVKDCSLTRDDYETLLALAEYERDECERDNIPTRVKSMNHIIGRLKEILKEDE